MDAHARRAHVRRRLIVSAVCGKRVRAGSCAGPARPRHMFPPDAEDEPQRARPLRCEARRRDGPGASQRWTGGLLERLSTASLFVDGRIGAIEFASCQLWAAGRPNARRRTLTLVLCCLAQFMVILDVSIVNVALPSIARRARLHARDARLGRQRLHARVRRLPAARRPRRRPARPARGVRGRARAVRARLARRRPRAERGGARRRARRAGARRRDRRAGDALDPHDRRSREGAERNRALGLWGAMGAIGGASGALLGGLLTEALSWRWILHHQRADRAARGRSRRCASCAPARRDDGRRAATSTSPAR